MTDSYTFYHWTIRPDMVGALERYIQTGKGTGHFLSAILENDFMTACGHADDDNKRNLPAFAGYLYNVAPAGCYGSPEKVKAWRQHSGLSGLEKMQVI